MNFIFREIDMRHPSTSAVITLMTMLFLSLPVVAFAESAPANLKLWYQQPADRWEEAMPIGNGRLGAMVFGGTTNEHLQLNEGTLVSGYPGYRDLPLDVRKGFPTVTNLIARHEFAEAGDYITRHWLGGSWACYQPLGDLYLDFEHTAPVEDYHRELDLNDAVVRIRYRSGGVHYTREIFASHPDDVMVIHLMADKPGALKFNARLGSVHPNIVTNGLTMRGQIPGFVLRRTLDWVEKKGDMWKYPELWDKDGKRKPTAAQVLYNGRGLLFEAQLHVEQPSGDEALLIFAAASSYGGTDPVQKVAAALDSARKRSFAELLVNHTRDYRGLFDRVTLALGGGSDLPTDQRLKRPDAGLAALYFQFGRYLMISGSRPGGQPLNLQGIWNKDVIPAWACQYTLNINAEMNYWPAEVGNLSECAEPLMRMTRELTTDGGRVAWEMYHARGWVAHHNTTLWRDAQPVDNIAGTSFWPMGGAWLCQNLMDHFYYTQDRAFLKSDAYPVLKGACQFYLDWLVTDAKGQLVTPVGTSPENSFAYDAGKRASACAGPAMDMAIIRELFTDTLRAAEFLDADFHFRVQLKEALNKLKPYQIGSKGQILEWQEEFQEPEPQHRHTSHLYGLYPGHQITVRGTSDLANAARRTLEIRGDEGTGWSMAWKINFWARLKDGEHAHKMLDALLTTNTLPSLLDTCPPFQIDGNFGGSAGIGEMLLQSSISPDVKSGEYEIELLPALPKAWPTGSVKGLCARGGFTVGMEWRDGKLTRASIHSQAGAPVLIRYGKHSLKLGLKTGEEVILDGALSQSQKLELEALHL